MADYGSPFRIADIKYHIGELPTTIDEKVAAKTGIPTVYRSAHRAYTMALLAALQLGVSERERPIDALIYVTQSPTWLLGSHACRMQNDLRLNQSMIAFDMGQGCSGFVQALVVMCSLLREGQRGLIVTADNYPDKDLAPDTACLFSAGAAVTLIDTLNPTHRITAQQHYTDGSGAVRAWDELHAFLLRDREGGHPDGEVARAFY